MRLRLTVQRNGLPAANILWNVPETNSPHAYTITRLLEDVNLVIPLEAEHWGLEHYVVELDGFECLHFSPVAQSLKEDDRVNIRPLMTAEVRARTLTGRIQISDGGQHLVDGVPFGRPYLRQPSRPAVRIPPRKRRRLDDAEADEGVEVAALLTAGHEAKESHEDSLVLANGDTSAESETRRRSSKVSKAVQFTQPEVQDDDDDSDEDDDFAPGDESAEDVSIDDDSSNRSGSDSDSDSDSNDSSSASGSPSEADSEDSSSDSDSGSESRVSSAPDVISSRDGTTRINPKAKPSLQHVPPGQGKAQTRSRNARRTQTNRLRHLKETGALPQDATLDDLRKYQQGTHQSQQHRPAAKPFSSSTGKRKRLDNEHESDVAAEHAAELEKRKQELMARFSEQTSESSIHTPELAQTPITEAVDSSKSTPNRHKLTVSERSRPKSAQPPVTEAAVSPQSAPDEQQDSPSQASQRLRPNVSAIARILARQAPALKKTPKVKPAKEKSPEPEGVSDPDFWKSSINLSAFECWEEDFELSAPPYPFKQHWDPASKLMRDKASKKRQKKGNKKESPQVEEQEEEEEEEEKIILNYDDTPMEETPDAQITAAIEDQLRHDVAIASQPEFPPLPADISALPDLTSADIKAGAFIVCRFFAVNPITVTPEITDFKTALVETEGDSGNGAGTIRLRIADRDLPKREKRFDSKGNQIYDAAAGFFMQDDDDDDDDDDDVGLWEGMFGELLDAKLLQAA